MTKIKTIFTAVVSLIMELLGVLAIPVLLMVGCNIIDYVTGLIASKYRNEKINSYKSVRGIFKKVCLWILVLIGAWIDIIINYAVDYVGIGIKLPFIVATIVAIWIVASEMISILENMIDIGIPLPPFLMPIVKRIKDAAEAAADDNKRNNC